MDANKPNNRTRIQRFQEEMVISLSKATLLIRSHQNTLVLEKLGELPVLMHRHQDIASTHEFFIQIQLRNGRPVGVLLDACKRARVSY